MITLKNMLNTVASEVLSGSSQGCHLTDRQIAIVCDSEADLRAWARRAGVTVERGQLGGRPGWWVRKAEPQPESAA